ncbi:MAG: hypothetical protein U1E29_10885 [Coriobacteriia bacterium]|nr:hypothetical protein [Coriobacteriia bacterium]
MTEFVTIPVPANRVLEVYELLAREPAESSSVPSKGNHHNGGWTDMLIERMFVESSTAVRRILTTIAHGSPGWMGTDEIAKSSRLSVRQVAASLGPLKKRVRGRYGMSQWPFESREFVDAGILKYSMSPRTADQILHLAREVARHEGETG